MRHVLAVRHRLATSPLPLLLGAEQDGATYKQRDGDGFHVLRPLSFAAFFTPSTTA